VYDKQKSNVGRGFAVFFEKGDGKFFPLVEERHIAPFLR